MADLAEVLESDHRRPWPRRRVAAVLVLALLLAGTAYAVDRHVRGTEERALAACADRASVAVDRAYAPVRARWAEVEPALDAGAHVMLRVSLYRRVSESAEGASARVDEARRECAAVSVLAVHRALLARRERCVRALDAHARFLDEVALSGRTLNDSWPRGSC